MNTDQFLFSNAVNELWINPHADYNAVFKTCKLTTPAGAIGMVYLPFGNIELPNTVNRYMVVELGDVPANLIGLLTPNWDWIPLRTVSATTQTLLLCFSNGRMFTPEGSYLKFTENGNIIIALHYLYNSHVLSLNSDIYVRFYTDVFYNGTNPPTQLDLNTGTFIKTINNLSAYLTFTYTVNGYIAANTLPPMIYKNGILQVDGLPAYADLVVGDIVDYISDPLLIAVNTFTVNDLPVYMSTLDTATKMIASVDALDGNIYIDDTECYVTGLTSTGKRIGAYYPRLDPSYVRMLTFKDWGFHAANVITRLSDLNHFYDVSQTLTDVKIYVYKRTNNQYKPTILDGNYIPDLMNLSSNFRVQALAGVNANLPIWRASTLENCPYNLWVSQIPSQVSAINLMGVYSRYGAISAIERVRLLPGDTDWMLPAYVGNMGGHLLTYGTDGIGVTLIPYTAEDHTNEHYSNGKGYEVFYPGHDVVVSLDLVISAGNTEPTQVDPWFGVFCYYLNNSELVRAVLNSDYTLTKTDAHTLITWTTHMHSHERYVRSSENSVIFTFTADSTILDTGIDIYNGTPKAHHVGMSILSIWLNGRYLTETLDYQVYHGRAYLTSKTAYWTATPTITVIYAGLPNNPLKHSPDVTWGWVTYGGILNDSVYDLTMYRNKQFYIDGRAVTYAEINEKEQYLDKPDISPYLPFVDGTPYTIVDVVQFTADDDLNVLTATAIGEHVQDQAVSDYVTMIDPQPPKTGIVTIPSKYELVSPFFNKVIEDVLNGTIQITSTSSYSADAITLLLSSYLWMIQFDPCLLDISKNFTQISPRWDTTINNVNQAQYDFLIKVNETLLYNQVEGIHLYLQVV